MVISLKLYLFSGYKNNLMISCEEMQLED